MSKLVIAFDVGTTFSGVSYCILKDGHDESPKKYNVDKFPGNENGDPPTKIPTVMYYDSNGKMVKAGAEATSESTEYEAESNNWSKAAWFKLRLRPQSMDLGLSNTDFHPLPPNKTVDDLFADYYDYLMKCTEAFVKESHPGDAHDWDRLRREAQFVLPHPNGWAGAQQNRMRGFAIKAGLVPDTLEGRERVHFVTEGEADLHYCIEERHLDIKAGPKSGFVVADLGGGTLNFSSYKIDSECPLQVHEVAIPLCSLEGAEKITKRARIDAQEILKGSEYDTKDYLDIFEKNSIPERNVLRVMIDGPRHNDPAHKVKNGALELSTFFVMTYFQEPIYAAGKAIETIIDDSSPLSTFSVYLVGGLSNNQYVVDEIKARIQTASTKEDWKKKGIVVNVYAPGDRPYKAAALGGLCYYIDNYVKVRIARANYGTTLNWWYDPKDPENARRKEIKYETRPNGGIVVPGGFEVILKKNTSVDQESQFKRPYNRMITDGNSLVFDDSIMIYHGDKDIKWVDQAADKEMHEVCKIKTDVSNLQHLLTTTRGPTGIDYRSIDYDIVIWFGKPEMKAQLSWKENGEQKWGPASIVYRDDCNEHD